MVKFLLMLGLAIVLGGCEGGPLNLDSVNGTPGFRMTDNLVGSVLKSSSRKGVGEKLTFIGLNSGAPKVVFGESGMTSPLSKVFENEKMVTLLLVASGSGGVDAFVIDKQSGKFARAAAGGLTGVHALASVGLCQ